MAKIEINELTFRQTSSGGEEVKQVVVKCDVTACDSDEALERAIWDFHGELRLKIGIAWNLADSINATRFLANKCGCKLEKISVEIHAEYADEYDAYLVGRKANS